MGAVLCVLCVLWVMVSCSSPSSSENDGEAKPTPPEATGPDDDGQDTTGEGGGGTGNTDSIFKLHCFTEGVTSFNVGGGYEGSAKFQSEYTKKAQTYIVAKFADLQTKIQAENPDENTFKTVLSDAINLTDRQGETYATPSELAEMLDRGIPAFYQETAKYIAQIINNLDGNDQAKFRACYDHLAVQAYEKSLTVTKKSNPYGYPTLVTVNEDKTTIAAELSNLGIKDADVEKTLIDLLKQVAGKQNIKAETLKDSVNLALDINGLYGLRDSVAIQGGVPTQTRSDYQSWEVVMASLGGRNHRLPPRARYQYDPSLYGDYDTYPKPMFGNMLDDELAKLQMQTQSYEMGR